MLMISRSNEISRSDLAKIMTPDPTESWRPIAHFDVVNSLTERAAARGLKIKNERFSVMDGTLYPQPGMQVSIKGARLFGSLDFEPIKGLTFPAGTTPSAGLRNSIDKSLALSVLSGGRVLVCDNSVLSAEFIVSRKHTSGIDLNASIDQALDAFMESIRGFTEMFEKLRAWKLRKSTAQSVVVELARAGAFSSSDILPVLQEYEQPKHSDFSERNAWSLYNAATERMKLQSPARQVDGLKALTSTITSFLN